MSLEAHLATLQRKHGDLEEQLSALSASPSADDSEIADIKRRKLALKDEIAKLERPSH